jgi:hypothetical protein
MGVGAHALHHLAVAVENQRVRRPEIGLYLVKSGHSQRRMVITCYQEQSNQRAPGEWLHFAASTFTRAFGASPNISGAYIASTRVGGRAKSPTLFRRTVYCIFTTPLGRYS